MAYLGSKPSSGFITTSKQRITSSTNNYVDLDNAISSLADVIVWVNFVKQDSTNLTLTTSTRITLGGTLVSSDIVEIAYLGKAVATQNPSTNSVTNDMLSGSIANSKLANSSITLNGSAVSLGGSATVGGGLTQSSTFYVTTSYLPSASDEAITNWAESDAPNYNRLGTSPTQSSGVFSLPETGWWMVSCNLMCFQSGTATGDSWGLAIQTSTNSGGAYDNAGSAKNRFDAAGPVNNYRQITSTFILKCENISTFRFRPYLGGVSTSNFKIHGGSQNSTQGGSYMNIMKLADV